ncbi:MAG TPA: hypothetical protein ENI08_00665 [Candidatus Dependentiae bacterium]|nr:hypothetical protein [Candidatus Dependentiae bacterium]
MNKKIVTCLFSLFSMTLFCAEENAEIKTSRKRCQREEQWQGNKAKRVKKRQNQDQAGGINNQDQTSSISMEIISEPEPFSFKDLKKIVEEIEGSSISQEEREQERKESCSLLELIDKKEITPYLQEIEQVNKHLISLRERITEFQKKYNLYLLSTGEIDLEDGNSILILGRALQATGQKEEGKKLEVIGLEIAIWKSRKNGTLNNLLDKIFEDPQREDTQFSDTD